MLRTLLCAALTLTVAAAVAAPQAGAITARNIKPYAIGTNTGTKWGMQAYILTPNNYEKVWHYSTVANVWGVMKVNPGTRFWIWGTGDATSTWAFSMNKDNTIYGWYWIQRSVLAQWWCNAPATKAYKTVGQSTIWDANTTSATSHTLAAGAKVTLLCSNQFAEANQALLAPGYRAPFVRVVTAGGNHGYMRPERLERA
jgi:hypothetical protein